MFIGGKYKFVTAGASKLLCIYQVQGCALEFGLNILLTVNSFDLNSIKCLLVYGITVLYYGLVVAR